jgi:hypothetical protein
MQRIGTSMSRTIRRTSDYYDDSKDRRDKLRRKQDCVRAKQALRNGAEPKRIRENN